ncbi:MAG TPA: serine hydrolase [Gemmatimonadaceae bacterium]|nr:serine hydrolase [Gemmatimonadaceae bacterium]
MLYDEGRFALDEPITRIAPELARLRVLRDPNGPLDQTDAAERSITFGDLLTHRSGLTYGELHRGPIGRACTEAVGGTMDNALSPDAWIAQLATLPPHRSARRRLSLWTLNRPTRLPRRWGCVTRASSFLERSELAARDSAGSTPTGSWPP